MLKVFLSRAADIFAEGFGKRSHRRRKAYAKKGRPAAPQDRQSLRNAGKTGSMRPFGNRHRAFSSAFGGMAGGKKIWAGTTCASAAHTPP